MRPRGRSGLGGPGPGHPEPRHLQEWETLPVLAKALFSPHWHVRYNAGYGLAAFGLVGVLQLQEISRQKQDRFAADMAAMVLDTVILSGGAS